ncbi:MAG TPA: MaoC family dehydratase [Candidatus Binataceae bacterium]|nr:MaoC family dehydratase [Candidatus Binataceae bacterium]
MSGAAIEFTTGQSFTAKPYLLDAAAAEAYGLSVHEPPRRRRTNIHNDDAAAKKAGYRAPIAAGEQTVAVVAQLLTDTFGDRLMSGGRMQVALLRPVFYGDTLVARAEVEGINAGTVELRIWVDNQSGEQVLSGLARIPA